MDWGGAWEEVEEGFPIFAERCLGRLNYLSRNVRFSSVTSSPNSLCSYKQFGKL